MNTWDVLKAQVSRVTCKPGWTFQFQDDDEGFRMTITVPGVDARDPTGPILSIRHYFPVPTATYNEKSWRRWIFECCRKVEDHELGEWFLAAGERPFAPCHGPGENPYDLHEFRSEVDARTTQDGSVSE